MVMSKKSLVEMVRVKPNLQKRLIILVVKLELEVAFWKNLASFLKPGKNDDAK